MLQYEIDTPLFQLAERIGQERAERLWRRSKLGLRLTPEQVSALDAWMSAHRSS